jgi:hypothetical protein
VTGYVVAATGVPWQPNERHRLIATLHGSTGHHVDRFSAPRIGGGPAEYEYGALSRPLLPGAAVDEFYPDRYAVGTLEYRFEPVFFSYLSMRGAVGWLDRLRFPPQPVRSENDVFTAIGVRVTTGFFFDMRLQIDYSFNTAVIRDGSPGGHEVVLHMSRDF